LKILDFSLLNCPIPLVQTKLFVKGTKAGDIFQIILSDRGSVQDVPAILKKMGHHVEIQDQIESNIVLVTVKIMNQRTPTC